MRVDIIYPGVELILLGFDEYRTEGGAKTSADDLATGNVNPSPGRCAQPRKLGNLRVDSNMKCAGPKDGIDAMPIVFDI